MNENTKKKRNTALFMLIATLVNVVLMTVLMLLGYILLGISVNKGWIGEDAFSTLFLVDCIGSIILAWFIYSRMVKWFTKRVNVNEKFAPLITPKPRKKKMQGDSDESDLTR